jgi:hypothetical protein
VTDSALSVPALAETALGSTPGAQASTNAIARLQRSEPFLKLLAARSNRYHIALNWWKAQVVLVAALPVALTLAQIFIPTMKPLVSAYVVVAILLLEPLFDRLQERRREEGARVQEVFDRTLYDLPWPEASLGEPPNQSDVDIWALREKRRLPPNEQERWIDWYPAAVGGVPLAAARIMCQRANGWWDSRQRKTFEDALRLGGIVTAIVLFVIGVLFDRRMSAVVEQFVIVAPLVAWSWREAERNLSMSLRHRVG